MSKNPKKFKWLPVPVPVTLPQPHPLRHPPSLQLLNRYRHQSMHQCHHRQYSSKLAPSSLRRHPTPHSIHRRCHSPQIQPPSQASLRNRMHRLSVNSNQSCNSNSNSNSNKYYKKYSSSNTSSSNNISNKSCNISCINNHHKILAQDMFTTVNRVINTDVLCSSVVSIVTAIKGGMRDRGGKEAGSETCIKQSQNKRKH